MNEKTKYEIIETMEKSGIRFFESNDVVEALHFDTPLRADDKASILEYLAPNHFTPRDYRMVHLFAYGDGFYITSNVRGDIRGYRCKRTYKDYDAGNIFAHGKDALTVVHDFIQKYKNLEYNRH